jgi:fermentation-respiration switch protein FrsA (DUF1100 family)
MTHAPARAILDACGLVLRAQPYRWCAAGLFALAVTGYLVTLPASYTGGTIGVRNLRYLNAELVCFSVALATLLSLTLALNVYAFRASMRGRGAGLSAAAVLASLVPSSLCCTSLVPSLLAALGASTPQIFGLAGRVQGTVARYEVLFLVAALLLLLGSLDLAARSVLGACAAPEGGVCDAQDR